MTIQFRCPYCEHKLRAPDNASGQKARCKCGRAVAVPPISSPEFAASQAVAAHPMPAPRPQQAAPPDPPGWRNDGGAVGAISASPAPGGQSGSRSGRPLSSPSPGPRIKRVLWPWYAGGGVAAVCLVAGLVYLISTLRSAVWVADIELPVDQQLAQLRAFSGPGAFDPIIEARDAERYPALLDAQGKLRAYKKDNEWRDAHDGKPITILLAVQRGGFEEHSIDVVSIVAGQMKSRAELKAGTSQDDAILALQKNNEDRSGWVRLLTDGPVQNVALIPERVIYSLDDNRLRVTVVSRGEGGVSAVLGPRGDPESVESELRAAAQDIRAAMGRVRKGWIANGARSTRAVDEDGRGAEAATYQFSPDAKKM